MLADNFKEIFDKYPKEKKKPLKGNELARKMREDFNGNFKEMISEFISPEYEVFTKISYGTVSWVNTPWAHFCYTNVSNTFKEGFYVISFLDFENRVYKIGFGQGTDNISKELYSSRMDYLSSVIREKFPNFLSDEKFNEDNDLLFKSIKYDDLTDEVLRDTFKEIIEVYETLIPYYLDYLAMKNHYLIL